MPKKSAATRGSAQRNRTKAQKSFELVRPETAGEQTLSDEENEAAPLAATASVSATSRSGRTRTSTTTTSTKTVSPSIENAQDQVSTDVSTSSASTAPKGSASARLAARRQATLRAQQRSTASLITAEHFTYVRHDLITIAILAITMTAIIVILFFAFGSVI